MLILNHIAKDMIGDVEVSTIYLAMQICGVTSPEAYYETMVFGGPLNRTQERCETLQEAHVQHAAMVAKVKGM